MRSRKVSENKPNLYSLGALNEATPSTQLQAFSFGVGKTSSDA